MSAGHERPAGWPTPRSPDSDAREWFSVACELEAENRQLRRWLTDLLIWIYRREQLFEHARALAAQRWPEERAQ